MQAPARLLWCTCRQWHSSIAIGTLQPWSSPRPPVGIRISRAARWRRRGRAPRLGGRDALAARPGVVEEPVRYRAGVLVNTHVGALLVAVRLPPPQHLAVGLQAVRVPAAHADARRRTKVVPQCCTTPSWTQHRCARRARHRDHTCATLAANLSSCNCQHRFEGHKQQPRTTA